MIVYLLNADSTSRYKIGFTSGKLDKRIAELQTGCPFPLIPVAAFSGNDSDERDLHMRYDDYRVTGEWFDFPPEVLRHVMYRFTARQPFNGWNTAERERRMIPYRLGYELWEAIYNEHHLRKFGYPNASKPFRGTNAQMAHQDWIEFAMSLSDGDQLRPLSSEELHAMFDKLNTVANY